MRRPSCRRLPTTPSIPLTPTDIDHASQGSDRPHQDQPAARSRGLALLCRGRARGQHPARTRRHAAARRSRRARRDFERAGRGFVDFLLLDARGFPLIVLEAKAEDKNPLIGKEQARKYARAQNCRFVILSNGNLHYFWDLERGNPYVITAFPTPDSAAGYQQVTPNPQRLVDAPIAADYIVLTQRPGYAREAGWQQEAERAGYIRANKLRFLRPYRLAAVHALQRAVGEGQDRFLFEMATGTGKTLTAAAVIKLFLRSGNARRVLFLVDRLELEDQAKKSFADLLSADFQTVVYKKSHNDNPTVRNSIDQRQFTDLAVNPAFSTRDFRAVPERYRALVPQYVKDYVPLNQFM